MSLNVNYFYSLTQRQFFNAVNGFRKQKDFESRERWMIARKIMYAVIRPHSKDEIRETDLLQFLWEEELVKELDREYDENYLAEIQKSVEFWAAWDAKQNAKA